jgi:hypothetical protein
MYAMIDEPTPFDTMEVLATHLMNLYLLPADTVLRAELIAHARWMIEAHRRMC